MKISAIISTYNRAKFLPMCMDSLLNQTLEKDRFEIIIINNNSTDNTEMISKRYIADYPEFDIKYFVETNQGLSYGRNRGIQESTGEIITFMDDDAFADTRFLKISLSYFEANPMVDAIGGPIFLHYLAHQPKWYSVYLAPLLGYFNFSDIEVPMNNLKNYPRGSNMTFTRRLFNICGLFNPELGRKGNNLEANEEKELFSRVFKKGLKVRYIPQAIIWHTVPIERTHSDFIKRQAIGYGKSERKRVSQKSFPEKCSMLFDQKKKWVASLLLWVWFVLQAKFSAANMLIRFRYWVLKGLFFEK